MMLYLYCNTRVANVCVNGCFGERFAPEILSVELLLLRPETYQSVKYYLLLMSIVDNYPLDLV